MEEPATRQVYFEEPGEWLETQVINRGTLTGETEGPAVIEQYDSTTVVYPGWSFNPDRYGNLVMRRRSQ